MRRRRTALWRPPPVCISKPPKEEPPQETNHVLIYLCHNTGVFNWNVTQNLNAADLNNSFLQPNTFGAITDWNDYNFDLLSDLIGLTVPGSCPCSGLTDAQGNLFSQDPADFVAPGTNTITFGNNVFGPIQICLEVMLLIGAAPPFTIGPTVLGPVMFDELGGAFLFDLPNPLS